MKYLLAYLPVSVLFLLVSHVLILLLSPLLHNFIDNGSKNSFLIWGYVGMFSLYLLAPIGGTIGTIIAIIMNKIANNNQVENSS